MPLCADHESVEVSRPSFAKPGRNGVYSVVLAGSPNVGKTTLFNGLTGLRSRTSNFSGTTVEHKTGVLRLDGHEVNITDLPGMYSLRAVTLDERVARDAMLGQLPGVPRPDAVVLVADACNVERSLFLISQVREENLPLIVALNLIDAAERHGIHVDAEALSRELGCPVVPIAARSGQGLDVLKQEITRLIERSAVDGFAFVEAESICAACGGCPFQSRYTWSESVAERCVKAPAIAREQLTERIDRVMVHPVMGIVAFFAVTLGMFYLIFSVASIPMDLIDALFGRVGGWIAEVVPPGDLQSFLADGIVGGVGGLLVFLPQICILFFCLALLEDSGYLARAAFVMDRLMRRVGLPGTAFVPLLSAHACAIPAIMATRVIRDPRDRLVTILVAPLMTCSARIPVYAMVTALLFPHDPGRAALVFTGAYALGIAAALAMAFLFKRTILPGQSKPLVLELPSYRWPSLRTVLHYTWDRAQVFVQQAGTIILAISVVLWALATYPKSDRPASALALDQTAAGLLARGQEEGALTVQAEADRLAAREALVHSFAGRLGQWIEPVVAPLGFDWQIGVGVISSFAAREVIVSTLAIVYGIGEEGVDSDEDGLYATLRSATRNDGSPVFTTATCLSLLVFYVLAMQCLPTQAITRRETGGWKWPLFQLAYMTALAYTAAFVTYQIARMFTV